MADSFYWHDYETWGAIPATDRPCQFAGLRTDAALNPVGEPLVLFSRPADDLLPQPDACLVTGITPQQAAREGVPEAEFARAIQREIDMPVFSWGTLLDYAYSVVVHRDYYGHV